MTRGKERDMLRWALAFLVMALVAGLFGFGLIGITVIGEVNRRRMIALIGCVVLVAMVLFASSCGGGGSSHAVAGSSTGSYVVTIKGNAGSTQLSTTVLVTVK